MAANITAEKSMAEKKFERKKYLWEYDTTTAFGQDIEISGDKQAFVQAAMQENLSHVRHIENERMSLLVGVSALVAGILAVGGTMLINALDYIKKGDSTMGKMELVPVLVIFCISFAVLWIAKKLNSRWNLAFDRHIYYAKGCYYLLHKNCFGDILEGKTNDCLIKKYKKGDTQKAIELSKLMFNEEFELPTNLSNSVNISTMPMYCFDINKNIGKITRRKKMGTKKCFDVFYWLLILVVAIMFAITLWFILV